MHVLVTGGTGFIGSATAQELHTRGHHPVIFDRIGGPDRTPFTTFLGDVRDGPAVTEAMAHVDGWLHLAGVLGTQETIANPIPAADTQIRGGLNVLQAAAQYHLPGVYIGVGNYWMDNTYSITKTAVERFCHMYRQERGLDVRVVRALNAYGPGQSVAEPFGPSKVRKIGPAFICRALLGLPVEVYGDGSQVMDMVYVDDVAKVLVNALEDAVANGVDEQVWEAGSARPTTVLEIAQAVIHEVSRQTGVTSDIVHLPMRPGEPEHSIVQASAPPDFPIVPLEEGIATTVAWYAEHWLPEYQS